jgi:hypothetical protein
MLKNIISYLVVWAEKMKIAARNREENKRKQKELA